MPSKIDMAVSTTVKKDRFKCINAISPSIRGGGDPWHPCKLVDEN